MYDELQLDTLGDKKTALFLIMSDTDSTFNFLISMVYTQLFNLLCDKADDVYGGKLPIHVRCLIDECANIGQIPNLEKLVATIRSREISACLVLQARSQLKAIYKDNADTIVGNMDSQIFLGGSEPTTLKDLSDDGAFPAKPAVPLSRVSSDKGCGWISWFSASSAPVRSCCPHAGRGRCGRSDSGRSFPVQPFRCAVSSCRP